MQEKIVDSELLHLFKGSSRKGNMMIKVIIFGITNKAQELKTYIDHDNTAKVCAFTVNHAHKISDDLMGVPVIAFENILEQFSPADYQIALAIGYSDMNRNREKKFNECKSLGYTIYTYVSEAANVYSDNIGEGTLILPGCTIAPFTSFGRGNILDNGATIGHNTHVGDFNYIAGNAVIGGELKISNNCFLGAQSAIFGNISDLTLIAAGTTILRDTDKGQVFHPPKAFLSPGNSDYFTIP